MDAELHAWRAVNGILIYCCRDDLPLQLESIAAQIAEDTLRAGQVVQVDDKVASVSRGDTSISYKSGTTEYLKSTEFLRDYISLLQRFRRMKIPRPAERT